ncbi:MAG: hypothetical protein JXJ19_00650 [Elusimicrobia bacterium]|nr:hypothetical protein [Elusimicrobiota bacterium]
MKRKIWLTLLVAASALVVILLVSRKEKGVEDIYPRKPAPETEETVLIRSRLSGWLSEWDGIMDGYSSALLADRAELPFKPAASRFSSIPANDRKLRREYVYVPSEDGQKLLDPSTGMEIYVHEGEIERLSGPDSGAAVIYPGEDSFIRLAYYGPASPVSAVWLDNSRVAVYGFSVLEEGRYTAVLNVYNLDDNTVAEYSGPVAGGHPQTGEYR